MSEQTGTRITQLATVGVPVTDQQRAVDFYVGMLGFEVRRDAQYGKGQRWVEVAPSKAATTIALVLPGPASPAGSDTGVRFATADAEADHAAMRARGVDVDEQVMRWEGVPPMFSLRDPDGNTLYVVEQA